ncbi:MAG: hypothetical protein ACJA1W_004487, partial [Akkermansiaceae bacterium]
ARRGFLLRYGFLLRKALADKTATAHKLVEALGLCASGVPFLLVS